MHKKMLRGRARGKFGMLDAYVDTARAVAQEYPNMEAWQRRIHYDCFKWQIELTSRRTHGYRDFSDALPAIAQALRVD